ncbi:MAG: hypothetical protein EOO09_20230 [Chitinophagaceae bacterium]|nr:MAG: hypothetical protein EOO09_20230 [Chitinophagaceae bacterium]
MPHRKSLLVISLLSVLTVVFLRCGGPRVPPDPRGKYYAGAESCMGCHKDIGESYMHNTHYRTSGSITAGGLDSFFHLASLSYLYQDSGRVTAASRNGSYFQDLAYPEGGSGLPGQRQSVSAPIEFAIGSGDKAQSYGYWKPAGQPKQLPLTWVSESRTWTNSPGFPTRKAFYDRVILSRCLECHASYVSKTDVPGGPEMVMEKMEPSSIIYGIDCERCHGPSIDHVRYHTEYPAEKQPRYIRSMAALSRQQKNDLCASCHSGNDQSMLRPIFGFRPGDTLANYILPSFGGTGKEADVHGKQMQLLMSSKCYQQSQMTCQSCHGSHDNQGKSKELFVSKCMDCHKGSSHAQELKSDATACINCHMPQQASKAIGFNDPMGNKSILYMLRTHRIAVYPSDSNTLQPGVPDALHKEITRQK